MRTLVVSAVVLLVPTAAFAQEGQAQPPTPVQAMPQEEPEPKIGTELQPRQIDVRAALHTTPILQYGGIGASADVGIARLGPGTLAGGGGLSYDACVTQCVSVPYERTQNHFWTEARLSYHLSTPRLANLDLYPIATAGVVYARSSLRIGDAEYRASQLAPTVAFGAGGTWFISKRLFVAGEARMRFAAGDAGYELASGRPQSFDRSRVNTWTATTLDLALAFGARF